MYFLNVFLSSRKWKRGTIFDFMTFKAQLNLFKTSDVYSNYVHFGAHFFQAEDFLMVNSYTYVHLFMRKREGILDGGAADNIQLQQLTYRAFRLVARSSFVFASSNCDWLK